jgi:Leucine-rich repeat (LRR) protein
MDIFDYSSTFGTLLNIKHIDISNNRMRGTIPKRTFDNLSKLTYLNLSKNNFEGMLPVLKRKFQNENFDSINSPLMYLNLSHNRFSGPLRPEYGHLKNLRYLDVSSNQLSGELNLFFENFQIDSLFYLNLSNNSFVGKLDTLNWLNLYKIRYLNISNNLFYTGELPAAFENFQDLIELDASNNNLIGTVKASLVALPKLKVLKLGFNQLNAIESLGTNLEILEINNNKVKELPKNNLNSNLKVLRVENNELDFEDLEPYALLNINTFTYAPQRYYIKDTIVQLSKNQMLRLSSLVPGRANIYQWYKNDTIIPNATNPIYTKVNATYSDTGTYYCIVTNSLLPNLSIIYYRYKVIPCISSTSLPEINVIPDSVTCLHALLQVNTPSSNTNWYLNDYLISNEKDTKYKAVSSGLYYAEIKDSAGCLILSNPKFITVGSNVSTVTISFDGKTIYTNQTGNYQWFINGLIIANQRKNSIIPHFNGLYQLELEDPTTKCKSYSNYINIQRHDFPDIGRINSTDGNVIYLDQNDPVIIPNPTSENLAYLHFYNNDENRKIKILDATGHTVINILHPQSDVVPLPTHALYSGIYFIEIEESSKFKRLKWVIQK